MAKRRPCYHRPIVLALLIVALAAPVCAFLKFEWYYAPNYDLTGNLSSGMDADDKELWIALYDPLSPDNQGIHVFDAATQTWGRAPEGVPIPTYRFLDIVGSKVLVGGPAGAAVLDRDAKTWKAYKDGLPSRDVYSVALKGDEIWFGTNKGIGRLDASGNWTYYSTESGLPNDVVTYMLFDGPILWICTESGIAQLDTESGTWKTYSDADGLPGNAARKALVVGESVWFALKGGIARIDRNTGEVTGYTQSDGLLSDEFKDIAVFGDRIYFASNKGVNYRSASKEGKWKGITKKQGLPTRSDATHLGVQGDYLWIALWYEGIMRMSIPTGLAIIPTWVWIVALAVAGIAALIIIRPGAGKGKVEEKEKRIEQRREKAKTEKPPHELCGGVPQRQLCNRCGFNTLKAGKLFCAKYSKPIEYQKPPTPGPSEG